MISERERKRERERSSVVRVSVRGSIHGMPTRFTMSVEAWGITLERGREGV
jgi:hypothetical protein